MGLRILLAALALNAALAGLAAAQPIPAQAPADHRLTAAMRAFDDALADLESGLAAGARRAHNLLMPALEVFHQAGRSDLEAETLYALGLAQARMGQPEPALELYRQALAMQRGLSNPRGEAAVLNNIGLIFAETGKPIEALAHLEAALPLRRAAGDARGEAATAHNLAALHVELGEVQSGLDYYHRALTLHRRLDDPGAEAATLNNLGLVLARLGEHEQAESYLHQALALHRAAGNQRGEAGTLGNLGLASFELDRHALALGHLAAARDLYRTIDDRAGEGDMRNNLGLVHLEAEQLAPARDELELALGIQRSLADRHAEAAVLSNLGRLHRKRRHFDRALSLLERALDLHRQVEDAWSTSFTLLELAHLAADRGRPDHALDHVEAAITRVESLRSRVMSPSYRASLLGDRREIYQLRVDLLMDLDRRKPGNGYAGLALAAAEAARARGLLDSLGEAGAGIGRGVDPELLAAEQTLRRRLSAWEAHRRRLARQGDTQSAEQVGEEIEALLGDYRRLQGEVRAQHPRYAELVRPEPLSADAMRRLLDDSTVILEYSLGEERGALWAVTAEAVTGFVLPPRQRIEKAARRLHDLLGQSRERAFQGPARVAAAELTRLILAPAREVLDHRRVVVVADGALEYVPFGILPAGGVAQRPLGLDREVVALPSISVLASQRRGQPGRPTPAKTIAILADPVFDPNDPRAAVEGVSPPTADSVPVEILPRLLHSRREAEKVAAMVPAGQRLLALDFAARPELFTGGELEPFRIVHVATHGMLDTQRPELSALVLSQLDAAGNPRDGHLRLLDIYNLRLRADLVVLSACRTALGREIRGEGLISLARGFLYAGARQVLVSLWQVDDEATAVLMERFYRGLLLEGLPAAAALRVAQQHVAGNSRWRAPYYWAGFVLQGDWR